MPQQLQHLGGGARPVDGHLSGHLSHCWHFCRGDISQQSQHGSVLAQLIILHFHGHSLHFSRGSRLQHSQHGTSSLHTICGQSGCFLAMQGKSTEVGQHGQIGGGSCPFARRTQNTQEIN